MYVILIDKPGSYRMEADDDVVALEAYRYAVDGTVLLVLTVAEAPAGARVRIVGADGSVNDMPCRLLGRHSDAEAARRDILSLHAPAVCGATVERLP
jgi:hypothetical protein